MSKLISIAVILCLSLVSPVMAQELVIPLFPHLVGLDDGTLRVVFSRADIDVVGNSPVDHYEAILGLGYIVPLSNNYYDIHPSDLLLGEIEGEVGVTFRACLKDGTVGNCSETIHIKKETLNNPSLRAMSFTDDGRINVYSPVYGAIKILPKGTTSNVTTLEWGFWQHQTGFHKPGGGIKGSDDTLAWDVNLNVNIPYGSNLDVGMPVFSLGYGKVVKYAGLVSPGTDACKSYLVDHNGWWHGGLHCSSVRVREGDYVSPLTIIGNVGRSGTDNDHLHLVIYQGKNLPGELKSIDASFSTSPMTITFGSIASIKVGTKVKLPATGKGTYGLISFDLNSATWYNNTVWRSSKQTIAKVDGYGNVTGIAPGTAEITVYFSGAKNSKIVTIVK